MWYPSGPGGNASLTPWNSWFIDVRNGLSIELDPSECGHSREYDYGVGYESPLGAIPFATVGARQCDYTLEERHDENS